ncbi:hypothetical protein [Microbispora sp. NBRC 16548]|uniref:hypothetical protein n=1 Tax=Microbispora sp. NBRC 16548 TaxID=3030994 RepID=UPI0024A52EC1|nr:hypothetical protein [Microbispora sp. NBRC 16548]GLX11169.1 hypothetical protein Misp03_80950 [Microbispora sp. NBRC 16548]
MTSRQLPSLAAEQAVTDLRLILAEHKRSQAPITLRPGRIPLAGGDPERRRRELTLAALVAVVEHFSLHLLIKTTPVVNESSVASWPKQEKAWKDHHNVDLRQDTAEYSVVRGFIEARNAVLHGLGELTKMQQQPNKLPHVLQDLKKARIELDGIRLVVTKRDLDRCSEHSRRFVSQLDLISRSFTAL